MVGEVSAAGDIASGALLARAFEPRAGEATGAPTGELCLNCGTALVGAFCYACGQNGHVHKTLGAIGHDLMHGVFHFEGKIWRTLPMLLFRPGALTRRYIDGERARFVSPLAAFLFIAFLMFATIHAIAGEFEFPENTPQGRKELVAKLDRQLSKAQTALVRAQQQRAKGEQEDDDLAERRAVVSSLQQARTEIAAGKNPIKVTFFGFKTGWTSFDRRVDKANANPGLTIYKLQTSAYKYSWALIPISVPFVALLFLWRRQYRLYDHTIFVTYSLSFVMILVALLVAAGKVGAGAVFLALTAMIIPPVHMFVQLRGTYSLSKWAAFWRTIALATFALFAFSLFAVLLFGLGIME